MVSSKIEDLNIDWFERKKKFAFFPHFFFILKHQSKLIFCLFKCVELDLLNVMCV